MPLAFFVLTQYRRVTDGRTDGRTRCCAYYPRDAMLARVKTSRRTARRPLRHAALPDNLGYGLQSITKRSISADQVNPSTCVEWAVDHFGLGLT